METSDIIKIKVSKCYHKSILGLFKLSEIVMCFIIFCILNVESYTRNQNYRIYSALLRFLTIFSLIYFIGIYFMNLFGKLYTLPGPWILLELLFNAVLLLFFIVSSFLSASFSYRYRKRTTIAILLFILNSSLISEILVQVQLTRKSFYYSIIPENVDEGVEIVKDTKKPIYTKVQESDHCKPEKSVLTELESFTDTEQSVEQRNQVSTRSISPSNEVPDYHWVKVSEKPTNITNNQASKPRRDPKYGILNFHSPAYAENPVKIVEQVSGKCLPSESTNEGVHISSKKLEEASLSSSSFESQLNSNEETFVDNH